jgi:hypothetical protein
VEAIATFFEDGADLLASILDVFDVALWGRDPPLCVACSLRPIGDFEHAGDLCRACYLEALPLPSPRPPRPTRPDSTPSPGSGRTISY